VLARLDRVSGVLESRVEATGRVFALTLAEGADEGAAIAGAAAALRGVPRRLEPAEAAAQTRARASGDPWFTGRDVAALCFLESRLLASRGAVAVAAAAGLSPAERAGVEEAFRDVLFGAMERVLAEGGRDSSGWFYEEWPALAAEIAGRVAALVAPARRGRARDALAALHARGATCGTG
jgi:hypothetical protein